MYSKSRNTLTALIVAASFLASGWLFGRPIQAAAHHDAAGAIAAASPVVASIGAGDSAWRGPHMRHLSLAMPYYSFLPIVTDRRAD
ncbi:MAG: hypothetical protein JSR34_09115 [Proteobacteria bacterium]|nr:hypothetical protein [Pseudomonadota bacterium]